ncbi:MAG TPA: efflux transporter outer membrane subunit [Sphingomicrobium sp.]
MKHAAALLALLATACSTMEPRFERPDAAIPASWPVGDPYVVTAEAGLPALTYKQVFQDPRLQTLISQGIANNRDLMTAAANIAAAREQFRIQRSQQFPRLDAGASANVTGDKDQFETGVSVPSFEVDLFGRLRSLTHAQQERYFATEAGARATRLALVADIASAWLDYAADSSLLLIAQETVSSAEKSVRLTRARLEGGIAPRTDLRQAEQILSQAQADLAQQRTARAQDVNALQLLVGSPVAPTLLPASIDEAFGSVAPVQAGLDSYVLLRRPDVLQAEYQLRAANANIGAARAALFPRITLTGLLGLASSALGKLFTGGAFGWSVGGDATYTVFQAGAGRANVRLSEAQRNAAIATYQGTIQTAFREVSDALARRGTIKDEIGARQRQRAATADTYLLTEARYNAGIDPYLNVLSAQQSYYSAQRILVQTKLTAARNIVDTYRAIGGDALLQATPICQPLPGDSNASNAKLASQCSPI